MSFTGAMAEVLATAVDVLGSESPILVDKFLELFRSQINTTEVDSNRLVRTQILGGLMDRYQRNHQWNDAGFYGIQAAPHPLQDPAFPFLFHPATGEYIGFRWDYGDTGPMPPPLSAEVIQGLTGLFLSPQADDYYCAHGNGWDCRFTVVMFHPGQYYRSPKGGIGGTMNLIEWPDLTIAGEASGQYMPYRLHPGAQSLVDAGFESLLVHPDRQSPGELFLFNPRFQVTRTFWYEFKG